MKIDTSGVRAKLARIRAELHESLQRSLALAGSQAVQNAKATDRFRDRTGDLRKSVRYQPGPGPYRGSVIADKRYAFWVENGTEPHIIRARNARYLRFEVNGEVFFRKSVRHPGTKPTHFLRDAARAVDVRAFVMAALASAIRLHA